MKWANIIVNLCEQISNLVRWREFFSFPGPLALTLGLVHWLVVVTTRESAGSDDNEVTILDFFRFQTRPSLRHLAGNADSLQG